MKSHKSEVAITFICTPTRKQCRLSPESDAQEAARTISITNSQPATAGAQWERGCGGPSAQVLTL